MANQFIDNDPAAWTFTPAKPKRDGLFEGQPAKRYSVFAGQPARPLFEGVVRYAEGERWITLGGR